MTNFFKICCHNWQLLFVVGYPILLLPIPIIFNTLAGYTAYSISIVAGLWLSEAVPSPVAGMVPLIIHPLLGIQSTDQVSRQYMKDAALVFMGGYMLSLAFEFCGLHRRIALKVMMLSGSTLPTLLFGIMMTTMFLSMWMFNVAAAAMMIPIVISVLDELKAAGMVQPSEEDRRRRSSVVAPVTQAYIKRRFSGVEGIVLEELNSATFKHFQESSNQVVKMKTSTDQSKLMMHHMKTMFMLGISYSSNIGGTGVLTGTGPNLIALDYLGSMDPAVHGNHAALTFTTWSAFALLPMFLNVLAAWIYLQILFIGFPEKLKFWKKKNEVSLYTNMSELKLQLKLKKRLQEKYEALGSMSSHEICVSIHFFLSVIFWALHDPRIVTGWSALFKRKIHISTGTLLTGILLFVIPRNGKLYRTIVCRKFSTIKWEPLLDWNFAKQGIPWGVFTILGGGLALSSASISSGLSAEIVKSLNSLTSLPNYGIQIACLCLIVVLTEIMSNTAVSTLAVPILLELSFNLKIHPLYLTFPAAIACSYAFMLPMATGPNLIVYTASGMKLMEMVKAGFLMSVISITILCICSNFYGEILFRFYEYRVFPMNSTS